MNELGLIPHPVALTRLDGSLRLDRGLALRPVAPELLSPARRLGAELEGALPGGASVLTTPDATHAGYEIRLELDGDAPPGGYELELTPELGRLRARGLEGALQGLRAIRQLGLLGPRELPALRIRDRPRFGWRGLHLDVSRHFFGPADVKRLLDLMSLHGFNRFHWHLTDDQGWRLEIEGWPRLTELGSRRRETPRRGARLEGDGEPYGGFYTQDEVRDVVRFASERGIEVLPEIEMPGHSSAALAAYPELGNGGGPAEVATRWGIFEDIYSVEASTFDFLESVLDEVIGLFPFEFLHVGGDEAPKAQWQASEGAQRRMREEGLADEDALQSWFIERIGRFLATRDRRLIGWDEIREGGLPDAAAVMAWRGMEHVAASAKEGADVVACPTSHCYFDYYQAEPGSEPEAIGGLLTLETVHGFEPVPAELNADEAGRVLGTQGNLWTEYIHDFDELAYMAFPRAAALAEVAWSPRERPDFADFLERWRVHAGRLDALGLRYRPVD